MTATMTRRRCRFRQGSPLSDAPIAVRAAEFACYSVAAMIIHTAIAIPAVVARFITDITLGYSVFQAVKPKKRADLY